MDLNEESFAQLICRAAGDDSPRPEHRQQLRVKALDAFDHAQMQVHPPTFFAGPSTQGAIAFHVPDPAADPICIVVGPSPLRVQSSSWFAYFSQVGPFSYLVSALIMGFAIMAAWQCKMAGRLDRVETHLATVMASQHLPLDSVAYISGVDGCPWGDVSAIAQDGPALQRSDMPVSVGREIQIDSGLLEIIYKTGAKVILQGPATFEVDANGGFLRIGKLTGTLDKKASTANPQSPVPNPFAIRTPTAVVTDLGTEFGVEVDKDGRTISYVFRGAVKLHATVATDQQCDVVLNKGEAARAEIAGVSGDVVRRIEIDPSRFVRHVKDKRVPIQLFDTGDGIQLNAKDPHWQVVAKSNNAGYQPRAAIVASPLKGWLKSAGGKSRWIEAFMEPGDGFFNNVTYTYRTTFELEDALPSTAVIQGWFLASQHLSAIRLNGQEIPAPEVKESSCGIFHGFTIARGFVDGTNALELDVANFNPSDSDKRHSMIALCVELKGSVQLK